MKAITIRQPWAWAILHAGKDVENRTRNIAGTYRGPLAIHSSGRKADDFGYVQAALEWIGSRGTLTHDAVARLSFGQTLYQGCVLGVVDLVDVHDEEGCPGLSCSPWAQEGSTHLVLADPRPLRLPLQIPGFLGLWEFPDHLLTGRW